MHCPILGSDLSIGNSIFNWKTKGKKNTHLKTINSTWNLLAMNTK
jgi:hypothetical protein